MRECRILLAFLGPLLVDEALELGSDAGELAHGLGNDADGSLASGRVGHVHGSGFFHGSSGDG